MITSILTDIFVSTNLNERRLEYPNMTNEPREIDQMTSNSTSNELKNWDQPRYFSEKKKKRRRRRKNGESLYLHWIAGEVRGPESLDAPGAPLIVSISTPPPGISLAPPPPRRSWAIGNNPPT